MKPTYPVVRLHVLLMGLGREFANVKNKKPPITKKPDVKKRPRLLVLCLISVCILLCGFSFNWGIGFTTPVLFPADEAVDAGLVFSFDDIVNMDDLQTYLIEPLIAEQVIDGIRANVSGNVYSGIEIPDMREEDLGSKIIRIIFDRLFT
jgi:hypothetical protein